MTTKLHTKAINVWFRCEREIFTEGFVDLIVYLEVIARKVSINLSLAASDASVYFSPITIIVERGEEWPHEVSCDGRCGSNGCYYKFNAAGPGTRVVLLTTPPQELFGKKPSLNHAMFSAYNAHLYIVRDSKHSYI